MVLNGCSSNGKMRNVYGQNEAKEVAMSVYLSLSF